MKDLRESEEKLTSNVEVMAKNTAESERKLTAIVSVLNERIKRLEGDGLTSGDEQPQVKAPDPGGNVVVRSPNP
jgi:hypothetical protein